MKKKQPKPNNEPKDENQAAYSVIERATAQADQFQLFHRVMAEMGRRGGLKGGKARAKALSPERRKEIAKKAAQKRWGKI